MADDFGSEGLLEGLDGEARDARERLLQELRDDGVSLDELREAHAEGRVALLPIERALAPPGERYGLNEVAEKSGLEIGFLRDLQRALGLPVPPDEDEPLFTDLDVNAASKVRGFRAGGIDDEAILETSRVIGRAMAQVVASNRSLLDNTLFKEGDNEYDVATRWAFAARELNPLLDEIVGYVMRAQQIAGLRADVFNMSGLGSGATDTCVAFADLAGFTRLGEQVAADELGGIAGRLTAMATDVAQQPVRLVKMIGDAAMFVSSEPRPLLDAVLDLVDKADAEGEAFPPLRAGLACGEALGRGGDWYGQPVNLASRITDKARPGSVVVTEDFKQRIPEDQYTWTRLPGRRKLKGISDDVKLHRVRRAGSGADGPT